MPPIKWKNLPTDTWSCLYFTTSLFIGTTQSLFGSITVCLPIFFNIALFRLMIFCSAASSSVSFCLEVHNIQQIMNTVVNLNDVYLDWHQQSGIKHDRSMGEIDTHTIHFMEKYFMIKQTGNTVSMGFITMLHHAFDATEACRPQKKWQYKHLSMHLFNSHLVGTKTMVELIYQRNRRRRPPTSLVLPVCIITKRFSDDGPPLLVRQRTFLIHRLPLTRSWCVLCLLFRTEMYWRPGAWI